MNFDRGESLSHEADFAMVTMMRPEKCTVIFPHREMIG